MGVELLKKCFVVLAVFSYGSSAASLPAEEIAHETVGVCKTPVCMEEAAAMKKKIDDTVSPCDDFYSFACGNYLKTQTIPDDKVGVDTFSILRDVLQDQLKTIITSPIDENDIEPAKMVKKLYKSCMNKDLIEKRGLKAMVDIMDSMGGWPVVKGDSWDEKSWSWTKAAIECRKHGYSTDYVMDFSVGTDLKNSSTRKIDIDQSDLGLSQVFLRKGLENPIVKAYHSFQTDIAILYGADKERAEKEMKEALDFEIGLAMISLPNEKRRNATALYNLISIKDLQTKYPFNDWLSYFNSILPEVSKVADDEVIIVYDLPFYDQLEELIKKTSKRAIANYIMWRVAAESTNFLTDKLRKRQLEYAGALIGQQSEEPRWKECTDIVTSNFEIATSAAYVRKFFNKDSRAVALEMVNTIKEEFEDILKKVSWMDEKIREVAVQKLRNMVTHIGYPDELMDDQKLIEFYKKVSVDEEKYLESILSLKVFATDLEYEKLREVVNKTDWRTHSKAAVINAAYSGIKNSIRFPAAILQGQFFSALRPRYMNFGAIGQVIGHEITHGFDDQGRQFDLNGNLEDWWGSSTSDAYLEKAKCIIDQYANFTDAQTGLNLNGINTQGENIADNGGLKEAYFAYQNYVKAHGPEAGLPELNYTTNQLFWITSSQTWCAVYRPESLKTKILTGLHSPNQFRVNGPLVNNKEFSRDFQCKEGTKMNPIAKCEVW